MGGGEKEDRSGHLGWRSHSVSPVSPGFVVPSLAGNYKLPPLLVLPGDRRVTLSTNLFLSPDPTGRQWM